MARSYAPGAANTDIILPHFTLYTFSQSHIITTLKTFPIKAKPDQRRLQSLRVALTTSEMEKL
jgi:hypothetical protein